MHQQARTFFLMVWLVGLVFPGCVHSKSWEFCVGGGCRSNRQESGAGPGECAFLLQREPVFNRLYMRSVKNASMRSTLDDIICSRSFHQVETLAQTAYNRHNSQQEEEDAELAFEFLHLLGMSFDGSNSARSSQQTASNHVENAFSLMKTAYCKTIGADQAIKFNDQWQIVKTTVEDGVWKALDKCFETIIALHRDHRGHIDGLTIRLDTDHSQRVIDITMSYHPPRHSNLQSVPLNRITAVGLQGCEDAAKQCPDIKPDPCVVRCYRVIDMASSIIVETAFGRESLPLPALDGAEREIYRRLQEVENAVKSSSVLVQQLQRSLEQKEKRWNDTEIESLSKFAVRALFGSFNFPGPSYSPRGCVSLNSAVPSSRATVLLAASTLYSDPGCQHVVEANPHHYCAAFCFASKMADCTICGVIREYFTKGLLTVLEFAAVEVRDF